MSSSSLNKFLKEYPWESDPDLLSYRGDFSSPLNFLWEFELDAPLEDLWELLIDTSQFNRFLGLPPMDYTEKDGKLHGSQTVAGMKQEWVEVPWQWHYCKTLSTARIFSRGPSKVIRARYLFEERERKTLLKVYFGIIPKNFFSKVLLWLGTLSVRGGYQKVLAKYVEKIKQENSMQNRQEQLAKESHSHTLNSQQKNILARKMRELEVDSKSAELLEKLILEAPDDQVQKLRPFKIARRQNEDPTEVVDLFLKAAHHGILNLSFEIVCPHCKGARESYQRLENLPTHSTCEPCGIDFDSTGLSSIEVNFKIHPSLRDVKEVQFCAAEPSKKPHFVIQKSVAAESSEEIPMNLPQGLYRIRLKGRQGFRFLELSHKAADTKISFLCQSEFQENPLSLVPGGNLSLENGTGEETAFFLERSEEDQEILRPKDLFKYQLFRKYFPEEAIKQGSALDIGEQIILFTDVVGSTKMYEEEGDAEAFSRVEKHFNLMRQIISASNGAIVKTIGDATMACFHTPLDAVKCSLNIQQAFDGQFEESGLKIRISLHAGKCLAVRWNSNIDYFGNTVNLAAKLQSMVEFREIVMTGGLFESPGVRELIEQSATKWEKKTFKKTWVNEGEELAVYHLCLDTTKLLPTTSQIKEVG